MKNSSWKKMMAAAAASALMLSGTAFAAETEPEGVQESTEAETEEENYMTGDASMDAPLNQDEIGEKEILVISFGTSYNYSRYASIGGIERAVAAAFPDWSVRRAFTANIIIDHVKNRDGVVIDDVDEGLQRAVDNGVRDLIVCPTHLMEGYEYEDIIAAVAEYADEFENVAVTEPLFGYNDETDYAQVAPILANLMENYNDGETALVYMGHGTEADSDKDYGELQQALTDGGFKNIYITTVESEEWNTERVLNEIEGKGYKKVVLHPLMVVAGDHAHNDMASDEPDSLRTQFEDAGYEVDCILDGLGQVPEIQQIYVAHVQEALDQIG